MIDKELKLQILRNANALKCLVSYLSVELGEGSVRQLIDKIEGTDDKQEESVQVEDIPGPVYTQEFRVLRNSPVGEVWQKCKVVFEGKRYTVVENENGKEFSRKTSKIEIRDIDTRTPDQVATQQAEKDFKIVDEALADLSDYYQEFIQAIKTAELVILHIQGQSK